MNCIICHDVDPSKFEAPLRTMLFMEAEMALGDISGMVGPTPVMIASNTLTALHTNSGHVVLYDFHVERIKDFPRFPLDHSSSPLQ